MPREQMETLVAEHELRMELGSVVLYGNLAVPDDARAVVLFAHGSGSSRHSPRNRFVTQVLGNSGLATLLLDLLTAEEEEIDVQTRHLRFDIGLLAGRLRDVTRWVGQHEQTRGMGVGYFGASTGAAAALLAAAELPHHVGAVVSRGGRPDLVGEALRGVLAPTLLIVGGNDYQVLKLNRMAHEQIASPIRRLEIVPGATHLFEERGALEEVARLAREWFTEHLA